MESTEELGAGDYEVCPESSPPFVTVIEDGFGFYPNEDGTNEIVRRYTFTNQNSLIIQVITYGAAITSIKYPDKDGVLDDVALGFEDMEGYLSPVNPYFGATVGRCANRIAKGHFKIGDNDYQLTTNIGEHHLHGGFKGFDKVNWKSDLQGTKLVLTYLSKDGEEGYPGEVLASVSYEMTTENEFIIDMKATASKATPINLTNHTYFNLAGHTKGAKALYEHTISINADRYCHTDEDFIPSGMLKNVVNTLYDLRIARKLGSSIGNVPYGGYDQAFCIHKTTNECMTFIARAVHPETGRSLEVYSNQPGVQFYTANQLPSKLSRGQTGLEMEITPDGCLAMRCPFCGQLIRDPDFENEMGRGSEDLGGEDKYQEEIVRLIGKDGTEYFRHAGFCLMTQKYPDSVHRKNFPNSIIKPGEIYCHTIKYKFDLYEEAPSQIPEEEDVIIDTDTEKEGEAEGEDEEQEETKNAGDDLVDPTLEENGR